MNRDELKHQLYELKVRSTEYSLDGELLPDRMVLYNSYNDWIVFYLDERGNRNDEKKIDSESEACNYIYKEFKSIMRMRFEK